MLIAKKLKILAEYSDFLDVFLEEKVLVLLERTNLNQYAIELQKRQKSSYEPIYSLSLLELKILKTYIKINPVNGFIQLLKSLASAFIFFVKKPIGSF